MARIAITGATGFLGRRCVELLAEHGHCVAALGRNAAVLEQLAASGFRVCRCDLAEQAALVDAFTGCEAVVHCAALSSAWGTRAAFHAANVSGTRAVVEAWRRANVGRLIHISTPSIYMERRDRLDIREDDPLPRRFINDYARTKFAAEELVRRSGVDAIILRPQGIFGPRDTAILPRLMRVGERGVLPVFGNGEQLIDLTFVDNAVEAIRCSLEAPRTAMGRAYNITNGAPINQLAVIQDILGRLGMKVCRKRLPYWLLDAAAGATEAYHRIAKPGVEPTITRYGLCALAFSRTLRIDAARHHLGYRPLIGMEEGLERMIEWAARHGDD